MGNRRLETFTGGKTNQTGFTSAARCGFPPLAYRGAQGEQTGWRAEAQQEKLYLPHVMAVVCFWIAGQPRPVARHIVVI